MPTVTIEYTTDAERLELERALAYLAQMRRVAAMVAHGTVLAACEPVALAFSGPVWVVIVRGGGRIDQVVEHPSATPEYLPPEALFVYAGALP